MCFSWTFNIENTFLVTWTNISSSQKYHHHGFVEFYGLPSMTNGCKMYKYDIISWWWKRLWSPERWFISNIWYGWQSQRPYPLNAELNTVCHLLAQLGARHILHVFRIRVKLRLFSKLKKKKNNKIIIIIIIKYK